MSVSTKYQLSDAFQSRDGEVVIPGTEIATGRAVVVHLLVAGDGAYNRQLIESLAQVPEEKKAHVLETGVQDGVPFVVTTALPGNPSFKAWLTAIQNERPEDRPKSVFRPGVAIPSLEQTGPGEFTRFYSQQGSASTPSVPAAKPAEAVVEPLAETRTAAKEPSELTQFLRAAGGTSAAGTGTEDTPDSTPNQPLSAQVPTPPAAPRETTSPLVNWGTPIAPVVQAPLQAGPPSVLESQSFQADEFTRSLSRSNAEQPVPKAFESAPADTSSPVVNWGTPIAPVVQAPAVTAGPVVASTTARSEPGEFTRMFGGPTGAPPTASAPPGPNVGSPSIRVVNKGLEPPQAAAPQPATPQPNAQAAAPTSEPGEFTRMFGGATDAPLPSSTPVAPNVGSPANRVVNKGLVPPQPSAPTPTTPAPPVSPAPGEFTRFFKEQAGAAPSVPSASGVPAGSSGRPGNRESAPPTPPSQPPGGFMSTFETPVKAPGAQPLFEDDPVFGPPKPMQKPEGPGEFTKAMQSPLAPEPFWAQQPQAPPKQAPGEFTRMMQVGSPLRDPKPVRPEPPPADPNAFPWKPSQQAGEYTKIFESAQPREDQYSPGPAMPIHTGSEDLFGGSPAPRMTPIAAGPSEYTQMVSAGSVPKPGAAAPAPLAKTPVKPEAAKTGRPKTSAKPLIIIAGILVFLAIVLLVVLLVNR